MCIPVWNWGLDILRVDELTAWLLHAVSVSGCSPHLLQCIKCFMDFYLFNTYLGQVVQSVTWMFGGVRNYCQVLSRKKVHEGIDKMAHQHTKGMTFHFCYWSWNNFELVNFHCMFSIDLQGQLNSLLHVELWRFVVIFRRINNYFLASSYCPPQCIASGHYCMLNKGSSGTEINNEVI